MLTLAGLALAASEADMVTGMVQKVDQRHGRVVIGRVAKLVEIGRRGHR
jgi:GTP-sensing pleiotropic transcriptional regulator CodY